jgi:hypothetical protein
MPDEIKKNKKKLLVVKSKIQNNYAPTTIGFSFLEMPTKEDKDKNIRYLSTEIATCRERVIQLYASSVNEKVEKFDSDRMRLFTLVNPAMLKQENFGTENVKSRLFMAKHLLNLYETYTSFDLTKISTVKYSDDKTNSTTDAWLFTGGKNKGWLSSSAIFSYACLIIRVSLKFDIKFMEDLYSSRNIEEMHNKLDKFYNCKNQSDNSSNTNNAYNADYDITNHLRNTYRKVPIILDNHNLLFKNIAAIPAGDSPEMNAFRSKGGILSMCECKTFSSELDKRLIELFYKNRVRISDQERDEISKQKR